MSNHFITLHREESITLPPNFEGWLSGKSLARFIVDIIEKIDTTEIESSYSGGGSKPYPPKMMFALIFYCYVNGIFSSRKIEAATRELIPVIFIANGHHPDHTSIATFRKRFIKQFKPIFVSILEVAVEMGILKLGDVSIDGTKIHANASKHKAMSWKYARKLKKQLEGEIALLLKKVEEAQSDDDNSDVDFPGEIQRREQLIEKIDSVTKKIEARRKLLHEQEQKEYEEKMRARAEKEKITGKKPGGRAPKPPSDKPKDTDQVNFTDEESRIMPTSLPRLHELMAYLPLFKVKKDGKTQTSELYEDAYSLKGLADYYLKIGTLPPLESTPPCLKDFINKYKDQAVAKTRQKTALEKLKVPMPEVDFTVEYEGYEGFPQWKALVEITKCVAKHLGYPNLKVGFSTKQNGGIAHAANGSDTIFWNASTCTNEVNLLIDELKSNCCELSSALKELLDTVSHEIIHAKLEGRDSKNDCSTTHNRSFNLKHQKLFLKMAGSISIEALVGELREIYNRCMGNNTSHTKLDFAKVIEKLYPVLKADAEKPGNEEIKKLFDSAQRKFEKRQTTNPANASASLWNHSGTGNGGSPKKPITVPQPSPL